MLVQVQQPIHSMYHVFTHLYSKKGCPRRHTLNPTKSIKKQSPTLKQLLFEEFSIFYLNYSLLNYQESCMVWGSSRVFFSSKSRQKQNRVWNLKYSCIYWFLLALTCGYHIRSLYCTYHPYVGRMSTLEAYNSIYTSNIWQIYYWYMAHMLNIWHVCWTCDLYTTSTCKLQRLKFFNTFGLKQWYNTRSVCPTWSSYIALACQVQRLEISNF